MNKAEAINTYNKQQLYNKVITATPAKLTLVLYEELLKQLMITKYELEKEKRNINKINNCLTRGQDIIFLLRSTLNFDYDISNNLDQLYEYVFNILINVNLKKELSDLDSAIKIITEIKDAWKEISN